LGDPGNGISQVPVLLYFRERTRALELGGKELVAPKDSPGHGRFAVLQDPQDPQDAGFRRASSATSLSEGDNAPPTKWI